MTREHIPVRRKPRKVHTTNSRHDFPRYPNLVQDLEIARSDQVWGADITYVRLLRGFVSLAVIMEVLARAIRGWNMSHSLDRRGRSVSRRGATEREETQAIPVRAVG